MKLSTSLSLCHEYEACDAQYIILKRSLGPGWGDNQSIPLTMLLEMHGTPGWYTISNVLWALRATPEEQSKARDRVAASYCVEMLDSIPGPPEHAHAVQVLRAFAADQATVKELQQVAFSAWSACLKFIPSLSLKFVRDTWDAWNSITHSPVNSAIAAWTARYILGAGKHQKHYATLRLLLNEEADRDN